MCDRNVCMACECGCVIGLFFPHSYDQYACSCVLQYAFFIRSTNVCECMGAHFYWMNSSLFFHLKLLPQSSSLHHTATVVLYVRYGNL